jgi:hypothetical protein
MTGKSAFTDEEWQAVLEGPPTAALLVLTAERGGSFRESFAVGRAYAEARQQHGESELLDEIVSAKPEFDRHRYSSPEALATQGLERLREAVAAVESKGTPEEVEDYRTFVVSLARRVAEAHKEGGETISPAEEAALDRVEEALAAPSTES